MNFFKMAPVIMASALCAHIAVSAAAEQYNAVLPKDIKWQDAPSIGPGAKSAVIDGDPKSSAPFVMRLKLPPNTTIKAHTHPTNENVTIISGMLYFAASDKVDPKIAKAFGPGSYFSIAQGKPMFAFSKDKEVVVQIHGIGPWGISYLESKDAPAMKP